MDKNTNIDAFLLGRRPGEQGPRPPLSNQDGVGKLARPTGKDIEMERMTKERIQMRKTLRIGTWNVRSLIQIGKVYMLGKELEINRVDICGLSEIRWQGQGHFTTT